jgi:hypothetical protein
MKEKRPATHNIYKADGFNTQHMKSLIVILGEL